MPGTPDARSVADQAFHDVTAELYDAALLPVFGVFSSLVVERMLDRLAASAPVGRALDVGCGTGAVALRLAERGLRVDGIDHSTGMLAVAEREARARGVADRVTLHTGDLRELPFPDATFDVVSCHGVLHHLDDLRAPLAEMVRVLRPGGWFSTAEPCLGTVPTVAAWDALRRGRAALRRGHTDVPAPVPQPAEHDVLPEDFEDEHEEGPLDAQVLLRTLRDLGLEPHPEYWTSFAGMHHRSLRTQRLLLRELTRPWRHRRGNIVFVLAQRRG